MNVAAYKFVSISEPAEVRESIHSRARDLQLKGTVLLAEEGINLFLAGPLTATREFVQWLRSDARFADLECKESLSERMPFRRLLVKIKREIIRMNEPAVRPQSARAPHVDAATLERWLDAGHDDEGQPVVLLDTRNAFEIEHGRFAGALDLNLVRFSDFPDALQEHGATLEGKTVVTYCTGGIRCEKAALWMRHTGRSRVFQLDGGILKYLQDTDARHWHGQCFVFDERIALDTALQPACEPVVG
jgi:UPF0176 protein